MSAQLPLGLRLSESATFESFVAGANGAALQVVKDSARGSGEPLAYLWGGAGTGKTHLLQAACHVAAARGAGAFYLPLADAGALAPRMLEGMQSLDLICLDDLDAIAGQSEWERALLGLFDALRAAGGRLLVTACAAPSALELGLWDLGSRLTWGPVFALHRLDDAGCLELLCLRARARGLELSADAARYLLHRWPRDPAALMAVLARLDAAALAAQRRLSIPFIRTVIADPARTSRE